MKKLFERLRDFLFPLTAEAMQAQMLREVWDYWVLRRYFLQENLGMPTSFTRIYLSNALFEEAP